LIGINFHPAVNHQVEFTHRYATRDGDKTLDLCLVMAWMCIDLVAKLKSAAGARLHSAADRPRMEVN
jgi:hypothetical protein